MFLHGKYEILSVFPKGKYGEHFKKYSDKYREIEGYIFPFTGFNLKQYIKFFLKNSKDVFNICKFIKENRKIDLCFVNSSVCFLNVIPVIFHRIPYILSVKELINPVLIRKIIYFLYGKTVLKIITISKFLQNEIGKVTGKNNIEIVYSTIDTDYFDQVIEEERATSPLIEDKVFKIVNIGHIYRLKGQHMLVEAISKLKVYNISVELIGRVIDQNYYSELTDFINKNRLNGKISFTGELNKKDVIKSILKSDCVIVTSEQEGQSFVILESLYLSRPLVTTKVGIAPEVISDGINGLLFEYGNIESLTSALRRIIDDRKCYEKIKGNCKISYNKYFGSVNTSEKINKIIESII